MSLGRSLRGLRTRVGQALLATVALGAGLRAWLPPYGPGDLQNSVELAYDARIGWFQDFGHYGRGPDVLLHLLFDVSGLFQPSDHVFIGINIAAGVASIALVHGLLKRLGFGDQAGLAAALVLAALPMHVRYTPTFNRYILLIFLCLFGWHALLRFLDEGRLYDLLAALSALALAPQHRPEVAYLPAVAVGLVLVWRLSPSPTGAPRRLPRGWWLWGAAYTAVVGWPVFWTSVHQLLMPGIVEVNVAPLRPWHLVLPDHNLFFSPRYTPWPWTILGLAGVGFGLKERRGPTLWLLGTALCATAVIASHDATDNLNSGRYHLVALVIWTMPIGVGVAGLARLLPPGRPRLAASIGAALMAGLTMTWAVQPRAINGEYEFLLEHLGAVPDGCTIVQFPESYDTSLKSFKHVSNTAGRVHHWTDQWPLEEDARCVAVFESANCSLEPDRPEERPKWQTYCEELTQRGPTIARGEAPARSSEGLRFTRDPVPLGLYWVRQPPSDATPAR